MIRYAAAVLAGVTFAFTGQPSGMRLLCALAATNLCLYVWARVRPEGTDDVAAQG